MRITLKDIEAAVCHKFNLTHDQILGRDQHRKFARPRQLIMYLARQHTTLSFPQIGRLMCRDHTTILYGMRKIEDLLVTKPKVADHLREITEALSHVAEARREVDRQYIDRLNAGEIILRDKAAA